MELPIITLTTDWGNRDFFVGKFKGKLLSLIPDARIVDITHEIEAFDIRAAYFVVKSACLDFPPNTIHIIDVNTTDSLETPSIVVRCKDQYFICVDNGLPDAVFGQLPWEAVVVDKVFWDSNYYTFTALDYFLKVAAMLAKGAELSEIGPAVESLHKMVPYSTIVSGNTATVYVAYVDSYGNADLNITFEEFERLRAGRKFEMQVHDLKLSTISHDYSGGSRNAGYRSSLLLTVSSSGHLQLALPSKSAEQLICLSVDEDIVITFQ